MNVWKPIAIGCIGYIAGQNSRKSYVGGNYRRYGTHSLKDELIDILSGKVYQLVYGETRDETDERLRKKRWGDPVSYAPVYHVVSRGSWPDKTVNKINEDESEEETEEDDDI